MINRILMKEDARIKYLSGISLQVESGVLQGTSIRCEQYDEIFLVPNKGNYLWITDGLVETSRDIDSCLGFWEGDGDIDLPERVTSLNTEQVLGYINKVCLKTMEAFLR